MFPIDAHFFGIVNNGHINLELGYCGYTMFRTMSSGCAPSGYQPSWCVNNLGGKLFRTNCLNPNSKLVDRLVQPLGRMWFWSILVGFRNMLAPKICKYFIANIIGYQEGFVLMFVPLLHGALERGPTDLREHLDSSTLPQGYRSKGSLLLHWVHVTIPGWWRAWCTT